MTESSGYAVVATGALCLIVWAGLSGCPKNKKADPSPTDIRKSSEDTDEKLSGAVLAAERAAKGASQALLLGREEVQTIYEKTSATLSSSELSERWSKQASSNGEASVATWPMKNETGLPVGTALTALLSKFEVAMVNDFPVTVISLEMLPELRKEIRRQQSSDAFAPSLKGTKFEPGPIDYLITGEAFRTDEPGSGDLAVDYDIVVRVIDVKSGEIVLKMPVSLQTSVKGK